MHPKSVVALAGKLRAALTKTLVIQGTVPVWHDEFLPVQDHILKELSTWIDLGDIYALINSPVVAALPEKLAQADCELATILEEGKLRELANGIAQSFASIPRTYLVLLSP